MGVLEGGDRGLPVVLAAPDSASAIAFRALAAELAGLCVAPATPA
jgi:MinD-like ATPase involved in chromosome partitioning or flagellar assembly